MTAAVTLVSAFPAGRGDQAAALAFEYMAATEPFATDPPVPMINMERPVTSADILPIQRS